MLHHYSLGRATVETNRHYMPIHCENKLFALYVTGDVTSHGAMRCLVCADGYFVLIVTQVSKRLFGSRQFI